MPRLAVGPKRSEVEGPAVCVGGGTWLAVRSVFAVALQMIAFPPENLRNYLGFETFCRGIRQFLGSLDPR